MINSKFLLYKTSDNKVSINVQIQDETVWLTQEQMAELFSKSKPTINEHIKNIYTEKELSEEATMRKFGNSEFSTKPTNYYNLDVIISVGYRVKSLRGTQFRQWATKVLDTFTQQGYVLDKSRLINGQIFDEDYFDHLISEIQEIRASERRFYQKITDIYTTAVDYSLDSQTTKDFFATVQNKMHYAVHGSTAAEVIMTRADHTKEYMGLTSWKNAPDGKIVKADVSVAKNYLSAYSHDHGRLGLQTGCFSSIQRCGNSAG